MEQSRLLAITVVAVTMLMAAAICGYLVNEAVSWNALAASLPR